MHRQNNKRTWSWTRIAVASLLLVAVWLGGCKLNLNGGRGGLGTNVSPQDAYREARARLLQAANATDPATRSHAIEAVANTIGRRESGVLMDALDDRFIIVQYAGAMALGDIAYAPAEDRLEQMVMDPKVDDRVAAAAIYALHEIGNDTHASMLARILFSPEKWARASAAMCMGKMDEPSAMGPLRAAKADEVDPAARLAMTEALALLGDEASQRSLEAFVRRPELDVKLAAIPVFAEMPDTRVDSVLRKLIDESSHPRVRVSAAGALASRGVITDDDYDMCVEAAHHPREMLNEYYGDVGIRDASEPAKLQHLAALSLGKMKRQQAIDVLSALLESTSGEVRVAAAMAILQVLGHENAPAPQSGQDEPQGQPLPPAPLPSGGLQSSGAIEPD
ncbi:MAG: hypothetical protein GVY16_03140 [Planctomycetes bacterium]|jgi:HEAT repeat protein|nr:hypothetical protein [Planctomycetota bacterium]